MIVPTLYGRAQDSKQGERRNVEPSRPPLPGAGLVDERLTDIQEDSPNRHAAILCALDIVAWYGSRSFQKPNLVATLPRRRRHRLTLAGVRLSYLDWDGPPPAVLLLHGLAGHGAEWSETAQWLSAHRRVIAIDQRGHGQSVKRLDDMSPEALAADAAELIVQLDLAPVTVIGQSIGGVVAFLLAARNPDLVRDLVVAEADPRPGKHVRADVEKWLRSWPIPFKTREEAAAFLGGDNLLGRTWAASLMHTPDGLRPRFELEDVLAVIDDTRDRWADWHRVACPALVVGGSRGLANRDSMREMAAAHAGCAYVEVIGAGHDLHLEQPDSWREVILQFVLQPGLRAQ